MDKSSKIVAIVVLLVLLLAFNMWARTLPELETVKFSDGDAVMVHCIDEDSKFVGTVVSATYGPPSTTLGCPRVDVTGRIREMLKKGKFTLSPSIISGGAGTNCKGNNTLVIKYRC